ncbi:ATP-binding protein [Candidatus Calescamantes bacterium]|nr:ATP-binding protein [Candidatus Calescamantes bacterium]
MYTKIDNLLPRELLRGIEPFIERDEIVVILGARQVGKTCLLRYIQRRLKEDGKSTFFMDLEDIELRGAIKSAQDLLSHLRAMGYGGGRAYVFLDEVHYMQNATSILKYLHDHHPELKFFVTGSSSLKLRFKLGEPLTGRKIIFNLYPLSFEEYLAFSGNEELKKALTTFKDEKIPEPFLKRISKTYENYIIWGGYPKVAITPSFDMKAEILKEIFTTYLEKEVRSLIREEKLEHFSRLVRFLAAQNGNLLKILEVSKELGIQRPTVQRYLSILEETFMAKRLPPVTKSRQKELTRTPKLYFFDSGFINFLTKDFRPLAMHPNAGSLIETSVFTSLLKKLSPLEEINFWRTKNGQEVDFVIRSNGEYLPVEVKWQDDLRIATSLKNFIKRYNSGVAIVSTKSMWQKKEFCGCKIQFLPAFMAERFRELK